MYKTLKKCSFYKLLVVMLTAVIMLTCFSTSASAYTYETSGRGWQNRPITVYADLSLSSMERSQLQQAINTWNSTQFGTFFVYGGTIGNTALISGKGICGVTKAPFYSSSDTRLASMLRTKDANTQFFTKFVITINTNYTFNNGSTVNGEYYLKSVLMHELGHGLGLEHSPFSNSFMYSEYTGVTQFLSSDIETLDTLY